MAPRQVYASVTLLTFSIGHFVPAVLGARVRSLSAREDTKISGPDDVQKLMEPTTIDSSYDVEMFEEEIDSGIRESDPNSEVLRVKVPGCETARHVTKGVMKDGRKIVVWQCQRCSQGYLETMREIAFPGFEKLRVRGPSKWFQMGCAWQPCGELCQNCQEVPKHYMFSNVTSVQKCTQCRAQPYANSVLVDTHVLATKDEKKVRIKRVCAPGPESDETEGPYAEEAAVLLPWIVKMLLPTGVLRPLALLQATGAFVRLATADFVAKASEAGETKVDMVGDGATFLQGLIKSIVDTLPPIMLFGAGQTLSESRIIADTRGALGLCVQLSMNGMGDDPETDKVLTSRIKRCDSIDNALDTLTHAVCSRLESCGVAKVTDFISVKEAPRRALEVLSMFGVLPQATGTDSMYSQFFSGSHQHQLS